MAGGRGPSGRAEDDDDINHYVVLGLDPAEGPTLTLKQIEKAYRNQSRVLHPDKNPDNPNATADFQRLTSSFEVLRDDSFRAVFDARLRARRDRQIRESFQDAKRRKLASDLDERERAAAAAEVDPAEVAQRKEKKVAAEIDKELRDFRERTMMKKNAGSSAAASVSGKDKGEGSGGGGLDGERSLKVDWVVGDYGAVKLREIFEKFGVVEDVMIRSKGKKKKGGSAFVVMASKDAAEIAVTKSISGDLSNPLLVLPLKAKPSTTSSTFPTEYAETTNLKSAHIAGAGFQNFEASTMEKIKKAVEKQKHGVV